MKALAATVVCAALAGCATMDRPAPSPEAAAALPAGARANAEELMSHLARLRTMGESALAAEAARSRREPGELAKVKAAMALALSREAEESDILALADGAAKGSDRDVRAMAGFLHAMISERRRLKEGAAAAAAKLRDEKRAADTQKQRADSLQQKLDALTELEKSLSDRTSLSR